jgi:hypothetical protein
MRNEGDLSMDSFNAQQQQGEVEPSTADKIQFTLNALSRSWSAVRRKFHNRAPPDSERIYGVLLDVCWATSKLLDLSDKEFVKNYLEDPDALNNTPTAEGAGSSLSSL